MTNWLRVALLVALAAIGISIYQLFFSLQPVGFEKTQFSLQGLGNSTIVFARDDNGVIHFWADDDLAWTRALGYAHAMDRSFQLLFTRLIMQGRLSECVQSLPELLEIDTFMRQRGFARNARAMLPSLDAHTMRILEAYAEGINFFVQKHGKPWEFVLIGYQPEPWLPEDSLTFAKLMIYLGLAQGQEDIEKFIIETVKWNKLHGATLVKNMFKPHLNGLNDSIADLLERVRVEIPFIPEIVKRIPGLPTYTGSNNWVVGPSRSKTGKALSAGDPHLDVARLPALWYEIVGNVKNRDDYVAGITVPGLPAVAMGRNKRVSWSFTYGFMDMIDFYFEDCNNELQCKYGDQFVPLEKIVEIVKRKGQPPVELVLYKTQNHGILELANATSNQPFQAGVYLSRVFSVDVFNAPQGSIVSANQYHFAKSAQEFRDALNLFDLSCNFVFADVHGTIGYQQTGLLPKRRESGLFPLPGWIKENTWTERYYGNDLRSVIILKNETLLSSVLVTANDEHNRNGGPLAVNAHMGSYRADRIRELLERKPLLELVDLQAIQSDLYSKQAERFLELLKPQLLERRSNQPLADLLLQWDLRYTKESKAAVVFEVFYDELITDVFSKLYERKDWNFILKRTPLITFYSYFDRILFEFDPNLNESLWCGESREHIFNRVLDKTFARFDNSLETVESWGSTRQLYMSHTLIRDILPIRLGAILGFHYGPFAFEGSRATPAQGQVFEVGKGMKQTFGVSWRFTTEMGDKQEFDSVLPGGPSGNRFKNGLYMTDVEKWVQFKYKKVKVQKHL